MESYEKVEHKVCEFRKYADMTIDLMVDSYKWHLLSEHCEEQQSKHKYAEISEVLKNLFMKEHEHMMHLFRGE